MIREVIVWPNYVEVVYSGEVTAEGLEREGPVAPEVLDAVLRLERVLYDASAVERFTLDPYEIGTIMADRAPTGLKLAIFAEGDWQFGVARSIALWSGVEDAAIGAFRDRASALAWLLEEAADG
jgi:hypothetical protein